MRSKTRRGTVGPAACACARHRQGASLRSAPAARGCGLDAGSAHARPDWPLTTMPAPTPPTECSPPSGDRHVCSTRGGQQRASVATTFRITPRRPERTEAGWVALVGILRLPDGLVGAEMRPMGIPVRSRSRSSHPVCRATPTRRRRRPPPRLACESSLHFSRPYTNSTGRLSQRLLAPGGTWCCRPAR